MLTVWLLFSSLLYSSLDHIKGPRGTAGAVHLPPAIDEDETTHDANSYQKFKSVDDAIAAQLRRIEKEVEYKPGMQDSKLAIVNQTPFISANGDLQNRLPLPAA